MIGKIKFVNFNVSCLRDPYAIRPMQMKFVFTRDEIWFPAPCNGCEMMDGSVACIECVTNLTSIFHNNPDVDLSKPISPLMLNRQE